MKKKMNSKNIIVSFIFLIGGIAMLVFTLLVGIPSIKQSAEVCTLEVEAIVIDNIFLYTFFIFFHLYLYNLKYCVAVNSSPAF